MDKLPPGDDTSEDKPTPKQWTKRQLVKFGDNSSFSAVVYQFKSKSIIKRFLWGLLILASTVGFCYITAQSIRMLVSQPISTSITEERRTELEFPTVTICGLGLLNTTELIKLNNTVEHSGLSDKLFQLFAAAHQKDKDSCLALGRDIADNSGYNSGYGHLLTDTAVLDLRKLVTRCSFEGEDCTNTLIPVTTVSGVCLQFNGPGSGDPRRAFGIGFRQGLRLEIMNGEQIFSIDSTHGYNVIVHNRDEPPRPESVGTIVGLASTLNLALKRVTSREKTVFYSGKNCVEDSNSNPNYKLSFEGYDTFSHHLCLANCYYQHIADSCNCTEEGFYTPAGKPYTEMRSCNTTDLCCEVLAFDNFRENCTCPPKCQTVEYSMTASSATHSSNDHVGINVYYQTLVDQVLETTDSYTPWSLISDIGGNTGLFLGFTLLTVGEVVLLVGALCTDLCCSVCKKKMKERWANSEKFNY